mmetsp:Transcript_38762/g.120313  ORF Transcript_38762/g.120313 Transcript_38762/m.120313 type:complete len:241 (-) Transcript_38762:41-763(-)
MCALPWASSRKTRWDWSEDVWKEKWRTPQSPAAMSARMFSVVADRATKSQPVACSMSISSSMRSCGRLRMPLKKRSRRRGWRLCAKSAPSSRSSSSRKMLRRAATGDWPFTGRVTPASEMRMSASPWRTKFCTACCCSFQAARRPSGRTPLTTEGQFGRKSTPQASTSCAASSAGRSLAACTLSVWPTQRGEEKSEWHRKRGRGERMGLPRSPSAAATRCPSCGAAAGRLLPALFSGQRA